MEEAVGYAQAVGLRDSLDVNAELTAVCSYRDDFAAVRYRKIQAAVGEIRLLMLAEDELTAACRLPYQEPCDKRAELVGIKAVSGDLLAPIIGQEAFVSSKVIIGNILFKNYKYYCRG